MAIKQKLIAFYSAETMINDIKQQHTFPNINMEVEENKNECATNEDSSEADKKPGGIELRQQ